jgi:hypothetical protein
VRANRGVREGAWFFELTVSDVSAQVPRRRDAPLRGDETRSVRAPAKRAVCGAPARGARARGGAQCPADQEAGVCRAEACHLALRPLSILTAVPLASQHASIAPHLPTTTTTTQTPTLIPSFRSPRSLDRSSDSDKAARIIHSSD